MSIVNDQQSEHHFLDKFPSEITKEILSWLEQDDCLTCMSVCQQWYAIVPQCSQSVWKELRIFGTDSRVNDTRWRLCVGEHVQSVKFCSMQEEQYLYNSMRKLIDAGCNEIRSLAFDECVITSWSYGGFYLLLGQLAKSAIQLSFRRHSHGLDLNHVLSLCPKLTFLSFKDSIYEYLNMQGISLTFAANPRNEYIGLTHLFLDVTYFQATEKLMPIIQRCPNLQYLGYKFIYLIEYLLADTVVIDLDKLFSLCSNLVYLEIDSDEFQSYRDIYPLNPANVIRSKSTPSLRFFTARETAHYDVDKLGDYLTQNADTLEYLSIHGCSGDWTSVLRRLQFPWLRKLACYDITYEDGTMDMLLCHCPALEELGIMCSRKASLHILRTLQLLPHLKRLELNGISIDYSNNTSDSVTYFNQLAVNDGPALQEIHLGNSGPITDALLQGLSRLQALKYVMVTLSSRRTGCRYTDDALCCFIKSLKRTKIERLHLFGLLYLPPAAIRAMSELSTLRSISLNGLYEGMKIDAADLLQMLRTNKTLESVDVVGLKLLGAEDDNAVFAQIRALGFGMTIRNCYGQYDLYMTKE